MSDENDTDIPVKDGADEQRMVAVMTELLGPLYSTSGASAAEVIARLQPANKTVTQLASALRDDSDLQTRIGYKTIAKRLLGVTDTPKADD